MKLAIGICKKVNGKCSTMGCFRAYNNKDKHFSQYKDTDTILMGFFTCDICTKNSKENITKISERLKSEGVEKVHLGACAVKCKADILEDIKKVFISIGIDVIEGTH